MEFYHLKGYTQSSIALITTVVIHIYASYSNIVYDMVKKRILKTPNFKFY